MAISLREKYEYYCAQYFKKTTQIILKNKFNNNVLLQFFQKKEFAILCGINEVIDILKSATDFKKYVIRSLKDGDQISAMEPVLELEGPYQYFGFLEGIIDGILSRQTSIATNSYEIVKSAKNIPIIAMNDRADHYSLLESDGFATYIGGIKIFVTNAAINKIKDNDVSVVGTIPHVLIQMFNGNLINAMEAYEKTFPNDSLVGLVDFNNDIITDSLKIANHFKQKLKMIRIDTPPNMIDKFFENKQKKYYGSNHILIKELRNSLDNNGYKHIKIIISSNLNKEKIKDFIKKGTPIDYFGVGAQLLKINNSFICDAVKINGKEIAKVGRKYRENKRLKIVI